MNLQAFFIFIVVVFSPLYGCSIFDIKDKYSDILIGRNFDWSKDDININVIPATKENYGYVAFSLDDHTMNYDGINDQGLFIGIAVSSPSGSSSDKMSGIVTLKPIRKSLQIVHEVLKSSSNLDEAKDIFKKYKIHFGRFEGNPLIHYKIVQKDGQSIIIEFIEDNMFLIKDNNAKIMTNHTLYDKSIKPISKTTYKRFNTISKEYEKIDSISSVFNTLSAVKDVDTVYSNVYNLNNQEIHVKYKEKDIVTLSLKDLFYQAQEPYSFKMKNMNRVKSKKIIDKIKGLDIRPHWGNGTNRSIHAGIRLLLGANNYQKWGLEITYMKINFGKEDVDSFNLMGIVLEQRLGEWFNMSIGSVGYFNYGSDNQNVVGIVSNLGWEPDNHVPFRPFITFRNDHIFAKNETKNISSLSFGLKFIF